MMQRVIVIGHGYSIRLGIIKAVAQLGCEVKVIHITASNTANPAKPIDCYSKYVNEVVYFNRGDGEKGLVKLLMERYIAAEIRHIIIPTSDFSSHAIDNEEIKKHFIVPYINHKNNSVGYWMDKTHQKELALSVELNTAGSVIAENKGEGFLIPEGVKYPCFTKPVSSFGAGKRCQQRCNSPEELKSVLAIAEKNSITKVLVEDFIDICHEYAILGYSDEKKVVIPGIIKFVKESKRHKGVALAGEVLPITGYEDLVGKFADFIRHLGFVGLFDIDFLESNGQFYFDEMNIRTGGSGMAILKAGVNLPAMYVKAMCGENTDDMCQAITHPAKFVNEKMAFDDFTEGRMSFLEYRKLLNSADILFIKDETDVNPYKEYKKELGKQLFSYKRIAKQLLHLF